MKHAGWSIKEAVSWSLLEPANENQSPLMLSSISAWALAQFAMAGLWIRIIIRN